MFRKIVYEPVFIPKGRRKEGDIMIRCTQGGRSVDIPTNISCMSHQFSCGSINYHKEGHDGLNAMLTQIISDIQSTEIEAFRKDIEMTVQRIYSMYWEHLNASLPLLKFTNAVLETSPNRREVTKDRYRSIVRHINKYQPGITLEEIDLDWLHRYEVKCMEDGLSESSVWTHMKAIRTMFNEAIKRDLLKQSQNPFRLYPIPETRYRTDVLRFAEIEQLMDYVFKGDDRKFRHIRDLFCFACFTGLRITDLLSLKRENIRQIGDVTWLQIHTHKTGTYVQIPLSIIFYGYAIDILNRYRCLEDLVSYCDSSGPNRAVAKMLKVTGIGGTQHITMHTARRSCITALADFGVNIYTIQKIVGHKRLSTTQKYCVLSTASIENELTRVFSRDTVRKEQKVLFVGRGGKKYYADSDYLRCTNCRFCKVTDSGNKHVCELKRENTKVYDWCGCFREKLIRKSRRKE